MSSTNKTAELHLSQFIGTDIPSILTDYNGDMQKIDAGVREVKQATAGAVSDLSSVTARVTNAEQDISGLNTTVQGIATRVVGAEGDIDTLQSNVSQIEEVIPSNASSSNKLATIDDIGGSSAITDLQSRMTTAEGNIDDIEALIPSGASTSNTLATMNDIDESRVLYESNSAETWVHACNNNGLGEILENLTIDELSKVKILTNDTRNGVGHTGQCAKTTIYRLAVDFVGIEPEVSTIRFRCFSYLHTTSSDATASLYEWTLSNTGLGELNNISDTYTANFKVVI